MTSMEVDGGVNVTSSLSTLNQSLKKYLLHRNDDDSSQVLLDLQAAAESVDLQNLSEGNRDVLDFFINLHNLIQSHDEKNPLVWAAVSLLEDISRNCPRMKNILIDSFKFVPLLTKLLKSKPVGDRRLKILHLIQELTYGVKISWQEAHLPFLISSISEWITGDDPVLVSVSLGVLVNLCYRNSPCIYTLMKSVDLKKFMKVLFKIQKTNVETKIQVCKLLIILEEVSGGLPDSDVEAYVRSTCPNLRRALHLSNPALMKQIIDFFKDLISSRSSVVCHYSNYAEDVEHLLDTAAEMQNISEGCASLLLDYLTTVVRLGVYGLEALYPPMTRLALSWLPSESAACQALALLSSITSRRYSSRDSSASDCQSIDDSVSHLLSQSLPAIIQLLQCDERWKDGLPLASLPRYTSLVRLLSQLLKVQLFSAVVSSGIDQSVLRKLFEPLLSHKCKEKELHLEEVYTFFVEIMRLVSGLADKETSWLIVYNELLQEPQVQAALSAALYSGSQSIKRHVLHIIRTSGFSNQCSDLLASEMSKSRAKVSRTTRERTQEDSGLGSSWDPPINHYPLITSTQQNQLTMLIERCEHAIRNESKPLTSSILELYQYRVGALEQELKLMERSLSAAELRCGQLSGMLALDATEIKELHCHLLTSQKNIEEASREEAALSSQLNSLRIEHSKLQETYSQCLQELRSQSVQIFNKEQEIEELQSKQDDLKSKITTLESEVSKIKAESSTLSRELSTREETISTLKDTISSLKTTVESRNQKVDSLNKEVVEKNESLKRLKVLCAEKENQIAELQKELAEQERMRELISGLVSGKRKL